MNNYKDLTTAHAIIHLMEGLSQPKEAEHLMRFFKTGEGEYGHGDRFLGIRVPATRKIAKEHSADATLDDIDLLLQSPWHEIRLCGLLMLIELFNRARRRKDNETQDAIIEFYLNHLEAGNNWDLVDLVAPKLLGQWIVDNPEHEPVLFSLATTGNLWPQRVAIVATFALIKDGKFDATQQLSVYFLEHSHHLMHKATGWMLREMGKRGGKKELLRFLANYGAKMPRIMYRYAIERLDKDEIAACEKGNDK